MKTGFLIQARVGSTRLPGKVLMKLRGKPLLSLIIDRIREVGNQFPVVIITSNTKKDDAIADFCKENSILMFRGSEEDVLDRYYHAAKQFGLDDVVRLTGDNPLVDSENLQFLLDEHQTSDADYSSNKSEVGSGLPIGAGAEIFRFSALSQSWHEGKKPNHREHVNEYILENPQLFRIQRVRSIRQYPEECKDLRLTIDTWDDFHHVEKIFVLLEQHHLKINLENICKVTKRGSLP